MLPAVPVCIQKKTQRSVQKKSVSDDNESRLDVIRSTYLYVCQLDLRVFTDSGLV